MDTPGKLTSLVQHTEDLLAGIAGEHGEEIDAARDRLQDSLERTKAALKTQSSSRRVKVRHLAGSFNDYVQHYPWLALVTGVLIATTIGILSTGATKRSLSPQRHVAE